MAQRLNALDMKTTASPSNFQHGFSLVEILVGLVIGMFGVMIVLQVLSVNEAQKRTSTSGGDAQTSAMVSLAMIERDILSAGFGTPDIDCAIINAYNDTLTPPQFTLSARPLLIQANTPSSGSDQITIGRGSSALGSVPTTVQNNMPNSSSILRVNYGADFKAGDVVLISQSPKDCTVVQLTQDGQRTGTGNVSPAIGTQWDLQHNPTSAWNPPGGMNIFPTGGYTTGAIVYNMGQLENVRYYVSNNNLMYQDMTKPAVAGSNPSIVANGVISLKALYGRDTNSDGYADIFDITNPTGNREVVAVRIGILIQGSQYEKEMVSPASIVLWTSGSTNGPEISLSDEQRHYRYRTYNTIVPLRNILWNN